MRFYDFISIAYPYFHCNNIHIMENEKTGGKKMKPLNELRKKPYTSDELFDNIVRILRENHDLPCILDYSTAVSRSNNHEIRTDEFDIICDLGFGGSEGIYLTVFIRLV